ncbi:MAG TPA: PepSY-associated TM helix domain-containing protein, partial [Methylomirabilota bacterium]|nr:PepSY-associated TM helix domain-containing protein [Methylomirabilota bacterium]
MHAMVRRPSAQRSLVHWIHLGIGGLLSVPLFVLGLTGAVLVFEHEIDDWLDPPPRPAVAGPARSADDVLAAARAAAPRGAAPVFFMPAPAAGSAAEVRFRSPKAGFVRVFVDPASLAVLATRGDGGLVRTLAQLHSNLLARDLGGREIVGWLGVAMLILGASGLVLWWPRGGRWRAAFRLE